jgi:palmitoyltransferase ZDHHC9/14/18
MILITFPQIRNQAHKTLVPGPPPPNPFSHGTWRRNITAILCRPQGFSWLNSSGIATEDKREVNPGMLDGGVWDGRQSGEP